MNNRNQQVRKQYSFGGKKSNEKGNALRVLITIFFRRNKSAYLLKQPLEQALLVRFIFNLVF